MNTNNSSTTKEIEKLKALHEEGTLNEKEFELAKKQLLEPVSESKKEIDTKKVDTKKGVSYVGSIIVFLLTLFIIFIIVKVIILHDSGQNGETESICSTTQEEEFQSINARIDAKEENVAQDFLNWLTSNRTCALSKWREDTYKQMLVDFCQSAAHDRYMNRWVEYCEINNIPTYVNSEGHTTCSISDDVTVVQYDNLLVEEKALCIAEYQ